MHRLRLSLRFAGETWTTPGDIPAAEAAALKWLYDNTDGPNWTDNTNWGKTAVANDWFGITVVGGKVQKLEFTGGNNLVGSITNFAVDAFTAMTYLYLDTNASLAGDISGWTWPNTVQRIGLYSCGVGGDLTSVTWPTSLTFLLLHFSSVSGSPAGWTIPANSSRIYIYNTSMSGSMAGMPINSNMLLLFMNDNALSGAPDLSANTKLSQFKIEDNALSQADVDAVLLEVYTRRMGFTDATPELLIHGTNAAPSGVYQYAAVPSTGREYEYALENDDDAEGFNIWAITTTP